MLSLKMHMKLNNAPFLTHKKSKLFLSFSVEANDQKEKKCKVREN